MKSCARCPARRPARLSVVKEEMELMATELRAGCSRLGAKFSEIVSA